MKVISVIEDEEVTKKIIKHLAFGLSRASRTTLRLSTGRSNEIGRPDPLLRPELFPREPILS
jgi:hypothetical protein